MKELLVLTDFTANAAHAATAAARLAEKLGDAIILYHTLAAIPIVPADNGGPYLAETASSLFEDSQEKLARETDRLKLLNERPINISEMSGEGSLSVQITPLTSSSNIEMVVMGGRTGGAFEHLLSGSDTTTVIRKSRKPVLIVPIKADWRLPKTIVFATDYSAADIAAVNFLHGLAARSGAGLQIVHVLLPDQVVTDITSILNFRNFLDSFQLMDQQVTAQTVEEGLYNYCEQHEADVLAMSHGHHSLIGRLFGASKSRSVIAAGKLAALIFPPSCFINE